MTDGAVGAAPVAALATVAAVRERLSGLSGTPVAGHVDVYDEVHNVLQGALATLDQG